MNDVFVEGCATASRVGCVVVGGVSKEKKSLCARTRFVDVVPTKSVLGKRGLASGSTISFL